MFGKKDIHWEVMADDGMNKFQSFELVFLWMGVVIALIDRFFNETKIQ